MKHLAPAAVLLLVCLLAGVSTGFALVVLALCGLAMQGGGEP